MSTVIWQARPLECRRNTAFLPGRRLTPITIRSCAPTFASFKMAFAGRTPDTLRVSILTL